LEPIENDFMPYGPAARTVDVIHRIHEGKSGSPLTVQKLTALGVAEGNAVRVERSLYFLGLIDEDGNLTEASRRLRKSTSDEYPAALAQIIREKYAPVFEICDPAGANAIEVNNAFRPYEPGGQRDNMIRLFVGLCQEAGIMPIPNQKRGRPLNPRATGAAKARNGGATKLKHEVADQRPPVKPTGLSKMIAFRSGGTATLVILADVVSLSRADREELFKWVDAMTAYENSDGVTEIIDGAAES